MKLTLTLAMGLCLALATVSAQAAEKQVAGTVRTVDVVESSITLMTTVGGKEQDLILGVVKKTKVTVDGQPAQLKDVRKGQKATVAYDSNLDVATRIDATGEGISVPELATIDELPAGAFHSAPWLAPDGLTLYFVSYPTGEKQGWVWSAKRKNKDSLFGDFKRLVPGSDPVVTADGLEMILNDQGAFRSTTRPSVDAEFGRPRQIPELEKAGFLSAPSLSADGLTLYADRWPKGTTDYFLKPCDIVRFKRPTRSSKWGPAEVVEITGLPEGESRKLRFFSVSEDQLRGLVMLRTEDRTNRVLILSRRKAADPLKATAMVSLAGDSAFAQFPRWVEATGELFCMKADEAKNPKMVVIRNFDFDTATAPINLGEAAVPKGGDEANKRVAQALQGTWQAVAEEWNGKSLSKDEVKFTNRQIVIDGNSLQMERVAADRTFGTYKGTFQIDAASGHFDWHGKGPRGADVAWRGIYSLDGDTLQLCYKYVKGDSTTRPTKFKTDDQAGTPFPFLKFERQKENKEGQGKTGASAPKPKAEETKRETRVLWIGNSLTSFNDLPKMVADLAKAGRQPSLVYEQETPGGCTLERHWQDGKALTKLGSRKWDFVVLQEQSQEPLKDSKSMFEFAKKFDAEINKQGGKTVLYLPFPLADKPENQDKLTKLHQDLSVQIKAQVAPVGPAWAQAQALAKPPTLYLSDKVHPNQAGSYLAACVFYAVIYGRSPEGLPGKIGGLSDNDARQLQAIAWQVVKDASKEQRGGGDEAAKRITQALQGNWQSVAEEWNGKSLSQDDVQQTNRRIVIDGNSLQMERVAADGTAGTYKGTFQIDAASGHFDWHGKGPRGADVAWRGIYSLDGDTLQLCYKYVKGDSTARPTKFKTDDQAGTPFPFLKFERQRENKEGQGNSGASAPKPKSEGTQLVTNVPQRGAETAGSQAFGLDQFTPQQCQVTKAGNGIRVTFRSAENSGLVARAPQAWNWTAFSNLSLDLQNPGKQPVNFLVRIDDESPVPLSKMPTARGTIGPGESARFAVQLPLEGHAHQMRGLPTEPGSRALLLEGPARLNIEHVIAFGIFLNRPRSSQDLVITGVRLMPPVPLDGIVDRFGQYTRADWPGKLKNESELPERLRAEEADLTAHPPPSDRNRFGGSKTAKAPNTSGFFRTAKVNGKWWLVDPDGGLFFSVGVNGMNVSGGTWVSGRETLFTWLPEPSDPLAKHFRIRDHGNPPAPRRMYDFYAANLEQKYGVEWGRPWDEIWLRRLPSWGFNSIGNWSEPFYKNGRVPYTATVLEIRGDHQRIAGGSGVGMMHDPFDPAFADHAAQCIRETADLVRGDPWCIGYFIENERNWSGMGDDERREALAYSALAVPRGSFAKEEFVKQLRSKYKQISKLNTAWGTTFGDWNALDGTVNLDPKGPAARKADCRAFVKSLAQKYFRTVREAFQKEDPDHLYLGCRFSVWTPEVAEAAAEFCDVVSFNIYDDRLDPTKSWQGTSVFSRLDKPCLSSEFHFGALDRGMFDPGYAVASDQTNRGSKFKGYVESALDHPAIVGCHWYGAFDEDLTARYLDSENFNCGLVSVTDTPYPEMIAAARDVLGKMYARRGARSGK